MENFPLEDNNPSEKVISQKEDVDNINVNEETKDADTNTNLNINKIKNENLASEEKKRNEKNNKINEENLNINNIKKNIINKEKEEKAKNLSEVKFYLNLNVKDLDYTDRINNKSDTLFETLKEATIMKWETKLFNNFSYNKTTSDDMINSVEKNTRFQTVIRNDTVRTRVRESVLVENFKETLENVITYYCKEKNVFYKQGLNEIFGPLILMKHKIKQLKLSKIFLWGDLFIDRFLPNYYYEKDFYSLKCALGLYIILLKYHEPAVFNLLDNMEILPEMYATSWIMTLLSGKVKLDLLFELWDYIIDQDDPLFTLFILVSLLKFKRELIINCDKSLLPPLISNLTILNSEELKAIINMAKDLVKLTPYSFRVLANKLGFLIPRNQKVKEAYEKYKPQSIPAMPIFPKEVLYITYDDIVQCPDPDCDNEKGYQKILKDGKVKYDLGFDIIDEPIVKDYNEKMKQHICEKCNSGIIKDLDYILIDLRILEYDLNTNENDKEKTGFLPKMITLSQEELKSEELSGILTDKYIEERGKYHFMFLTSTTDTFTKFESKFYKEMITEQDKMKMIYGLMEQKKFDKELDLKADKLSRREIYELKEYDNLRNTLKSMQSKNYPYISFAYGGFEKLHEESLKLKIELLNHNKQKCLLCNASKKQKNENEEEEKERNKLYKLLWEHKKKIKYKNITQYFNDPKINISFASLNEYKEKSLEKEKIQILIATLFPQYKIEIYKFDIKKPHFSEKTSYYDLGIKKEEEDRDLIMLEELKVSDILGMGVDKNTKNIININIKSSHPEHSEKVKKNNEKSDKHKYDSYSMRVDFSSSNDSKNFFKLFRKMSVEYKNYCKSKLESKDKNNK